MVTIKKGDNKHIVSMNSYTSIYKPMGYKIVSEDIEKKEEPTEVEEEKEEDEQSKMSSSTPISEMSKKELATFAKENNIDTSKAKSFSEARKIVQNAIKESKM